MAYFSYSRYDYLSKAIRPVDDDHIFFFEPVTWGMIFNGSITGSGFTHVPGGPDYRNRSAYTFHYYCDSFVPGYEKEYVVCKTLSIASVIFLWCNSRKLASMEQSSGS